MSKLHIYPQAFQHQEAWIVGDKESLTALRDAISNLLDEQKKAAGCKSFCEDGEGYTTVIIMEEDPKNWEQLYLPYTDRIDYDLTGDITPFDLIGSDLYKEIFYK